MRWITCVQVRPHLRLYVELQNGRTGEIDIFAFIGGLDELRDPALFAQVLVDELGVLTWPNGQTISPEDVEAMLAREPPALK